MKSEHYIVISFDILCFHGDVICCENCMGHDDTSEMGSLGLNFGIIQVAANPIPITTNTKYLHGTFLFTWKYLHGTFFYMELLHGTYLHGTFLETL